MLPIPPEKPKPPFVADIPIHTIVEDPTSPFDVDPAHPSPPSRWVYDNFVEDATERGPRFVRSYMMRSSLDAGMEFGTAIPAYPTSSSGIAIAVRINHGRWVWQCAFCNACQVCTPDDPRGYCIECWNKGEGWFELVFPADMDLIAVTLGERPKRENRNWTPVETVADLVVENEVMLGGLDKS